MNSDSITSGQARNGGEAPEKAPEVTALYQPEVEDDQQEQQPALHPGAGQQNMHFVEETGKWTYTDQDGVSFEYDELLKAWFPMYNEQLIQAQQSAYGETVPDSLENVHAENKKRQHEEIAGDDGALGDNYDDDDDNEAAIHEADLIAMANLPGAGEGSKYNNQKNKRAKNNNNQQPKERKPKPVTSVFVTGLPPDTDLDEVADVFKKGGVFMEDENGQPRIKLYSNEQGQRNGEALVTYLRHESVPLAIDLLDDTEFRPGQQSTRMRVQQAVFKEKAPTNKGPVSDDRKKKIQKKFQKMEKKLGWFEEENVVAEKWKKVCILKHMFTTQEIEADPSLLLDLKEDIREECEKLGEVTNVIIYDQHPEGIVSVKFKDPESAELCVQLMNGRFFAGQRIEASIYDGHTKYDVKKSKEELEAEEKQRLERYAKWLEAEEGKGNDQDGEKEQTLAP